MAMRDWLPTKIVFGIAHRTRLLAAIAIGVVVSLVLPGPLEPAARGLIAWDIAAMLYVALLLVMAARTDVAAMRRRAAQEDESAVVILVMMILAVVVSIGAIFMLLAGGPPNGDETAIHVVLCALTILCSFFFAHTIFAVHYAHSFYAPTEDRDEDGKPKKQEGGLDFPGTEEPDYWDFLYYSFVLGMTAQTADVSMTARSMRRIGLAHGIISFLFNTTLLAITINIAAGLFH